MVNHLKLNAGAGARSGIIPPPPSARWWREGVGDEGVKGGRSRVRLRIEKKEKMEEAKIEKSKEGGGESNNIQPADELIELY